MKVFPLREWCPSFDFQYMQYWWKHSLSLIKIAGFWFVQIYFEAVDICKMLLTSDVTSILTACNNIRVRQSEDIFEVFRNWSRHQKLCYTFGVLSSLLFLILWAHLGARLPLWRVHWPRALFPQLSPFSQFRSPQTLTLFPLSPFSCLA